MVESREVDLCGLAFEQTPASGAFSKQIRQIADSIEAFGFNVPVLVDAELKVICGHGRLLACRELGWTEVPTLCLDHLTPAQARAFMIADNRLSEISSWDARLLAEQLKDLSLRKASFCRPRTGWSGRAF